MVNDTIRKLRMGSMVDQGKKQKPQMQRVTVAAYLLSSAAATWVVIHIQLFIHELLYDDINDHAFRSYSLLNDSETLNVKR